MRKPPSFQFYADDFLGGVATFSLEQRGLYITMLCIQWNVGHVSDEDWEHYGTANGSAMAQPMAQPSPENGTANGKTHVSALVRRVQSKFKEVEPGIWKNERMEQVRNESADYKANRSNAGKKGAAARWHSQWQTDGTANGSAMAQPMANGMAKDGSPSPSPYKTERVRAHEEQSEPDRQNLPTELPANFPASPDEAQVAAAIVGCPEEFARETWNKAMSRLGRDAKDVPIRSWRHYLAAEWKFEQNRKAEKVERSRRSGQRVQTSTPDHEAGF